ncbi:MAG: phosphotransferase [Proteobacteria bacterium]|nr:phosphotransferase [Pseudomonadota bacterium]
MNGGNGDVPLGEELSHGVGAFLSEVSDCDSLEIIALERLSGGAVQENYALDAHFSGGSMAGRQELVLRTDAPSGVAASRSRADEFAVLKVAWEAGLKVPEPLWACADDTLIGRAFYVMRRLPGDARGHKLVRDPDLDAVRESLVEHLGEELARLHAIEPPHPELEGLPQPPLSPAYSRIQEYRGYLDKLPDPQPTLEWGLRWLERKAPTSDEVVLCHCDYRTGYYLVEQGELSGILDWEFASWSDPLEDIAWFCARCWRFGQWHQEAGGMGSREAFYKGYERISGKTINRELIPYWEVMATVRWAIIALQPGHRHTSGEETSLALALTGRMVPEMELDILMQIETVKEKAFDHAP